MNYRQTELLSPGDVGASGTKIIDVNIAEMISRINIAWKITKSKHGMDSYPHKDITKIELVDGSDVLHSTDGGKNQALCIYDRKCPTMNHGQHVESSSEWSNYGIDFGRFLWDPDLALNPTKFKNIQLKITYNEALSDTGATVNNLEVWADCFDQKTINPRGFLMAKTNYEYTCGASGSYEYIQLPTDFPIRRMLVQGYYAGVEPWTQIAEARLDEENDKRIPFLFDLELYFRRMKGAMPQVVETFYGYAQPTTGYTFYVTPTDYYACLVGLPQTGPVQQIMGMPGGKITIKSATNPDILIGQAFGYLPNHCFDFPFGNPNDIDDWYDVRPLGSVRLRLKAGSTGASGTGALILQQLREY